MSTFQPFVEYALQSETSESFGSVTVQCCTFKNPVFVRWVAGGTPVRNNEFMYVATKEH